MWKYGDLQTMVIHSKTIMKSDSRGNYFIRSWWLNQIRLRLWREESYVDGWSQIVADPLSQNQKCEDPRHDSKLSRVAVMLYEELDRLCCVSLQLCAVGVLLQGDAKAGRNVRNEGQVSLQTGVGLGKALWHSTTALFGCNEDWPARTRWEVRTAC